VRRRVTDMRCDVPELRNADGAYKIIGTSGLQQKRTGYLEKGRLVHEIMAFSTPPTKADPDTVGLYSEPESEPKSGPESEVVASTTTMDEQFSSNRYLCLF
jgi:hypothetical protein